MAFSIMYVLMISTFKVLALIFLLRVRLMNPTVYAVPLQFGIEWAPHTITITETEVFIPFSLSLVFLASAKDNTVHPTA